ncbi:hypothetical protein HXX76_015581 [Chlamydomonas incerta]|uniref:Uncharacterized protein n=1 Tax=Chlamydomonas incerta TaxID=51695 RepID=A0A835SMD6_CHLIN|nr:hypothetical protein HXX76_015581 [Chlamydomonas incerta]|eukprot:KAG2423065.1 hypothetical protein HXX76_015581 [Chlamydomonas incerta]
MMTSPSPAAGPAADAPPEQWQDGDVLALSLADGRSVYAEVEAPGPGTAAASSSGVRASGGRGGAARGSPRQQQAQARRPGLQAPAPPAAVASAAVTSAAGTSSPQVLCNGARYRLEKQEVPAEGRVWVLRAISGAVAAGDPLLALLATPPKPHAAALRAWAQLASQLLRPPTAAVLQGSAGATAPAASSSPPASGSSEPRVACVGAALDDCGVAAVRRVGGLQELQEQVADNPGLWCDGSGPGDPPLTPDQLALYTAAELACLAAGRRGVVLLQLHVGWQEAAAAPPYGPFKPLVLRLLRQLLASPGKELQLVSFASAAPDPGSPAGKAAAGLSMVLCADKEPFRSWGAHLASFGCQAALEAQSPYYKALIGRVLGYSSHNIAHHIQEKHGAPPSPEVLAAVERQLAALSAKQPQLPWTAGARGSRKKAAV